MTEGPDAQIERLEEHLAGAEASLSSLRVLDRRDAERVAEWMDRLASQLLAVSEPRRMEDVHRQLGTDPVSAGEFAELALEMQPPDGEG